MFNNSEPKVVPFDSSLGADISGIDVSQELSPEIIKFIQMAFDEYLVLRFRDQHITASDLVALTRKFGKLDGTNNGSNDPDVYTVSNIIENGVPIGSLGDGEVYWHTDMNFVQNPPKGTLLYGCEIPDTGGNTYFANMYAAYDALPDDVKDKIEDRIVNHIPPVPLVQAPYPVNPQAVRSNISGTSFIGTTRLSPNEVTDNLGLPGAATYLVRRDPQTGRKGLFLGRRPRAYIIGLELEESEWLLDLLWGYATRTEMTCCQEWRVGDLIMYDNISVLHRRSAFGSQERRILLRTEIKGTEKINYVPSHQTALPARNAA